MEQGKLFSQDKLKEIREQFYYVDKDANGCSRLFFDNAGGSFRLKKAEERFREIDMIPDCSERNHKMAKYLQEIEEQGKDDVRTIFNIKGGSIVTALTASQAIFQLTGSVAENIPGTNIVTSVLEHPSAFDAVGYYAEKTGKEVRVAKSNPLTGGVDAEEIAGLIDQDTVLLNVMYASNISGAIFNIPEIIKTARKIKPDLYIIVDAVQHTPHGAMDFFGLDVDAVTFAPYKFFGVRGIGVAYISERMAKLPHHKLAGKKEGEWELGSPAPAQYAMITEIINYVCSLSEDKAETSRREAFANGMEQIALHERALLYHLLEGTEKNRGLRGRKGINVFMDHGSLTTRDLIIGIGFDNIDYADAVKEYEKRGVIVYERVASSLYSRRMLESFNLKGAIRVSPLHCNSIDELDQFLEVTEEISKL
ncbi:aminotransferase class V-fold PLP-dependent enzyme [Lacrimispora sp.]|uniref:aminotransferase class V-fold PLP-dependent enzyme n=1 Tax=Lacrimispora sp. TaxID=2719234 RepID=UPI0032E4D9D3